MKTAWSYRACRLLWPATAMALILASCSGIIRQPPPGPPDEPSLRGQPVGPQPMTTPQIQDPDEMRAADVTPAAGGITPVYVTLAGHLEDDPRYEVCELYPPFRDKLLAFAERIAAASVPFNLQIDYQFFSGVQNCETEAMRAETGGYNLIDYLARHYGFEIDAHQEGGTDEGDDNYADVRYLGGQVTDLISENVGGMVWDDPAQFGVLRDGMPGWLYPEFTWLPEILTLGVAQVHHYGDFSDDDLTSGVWKPQGAGESFWTHGPDQRMVYVGPGMQHSNWFGSRECTFQSAADYIQVLAGYLERGEIEGGKLYTASIAIPQNVILDASAWAKVQEMLDQLAPLEASGQVVYATYSQVVDFWRTRYGSEPNIFRFEEIDPADYTCP